MAQQPKERPPAPPQKRQVSFRRSLYQDTEDHARALIGRRAVADDLCVTFGRLVGPDAQRDVVLPVSNELVLKEHSHTFAPAVPEGAYDLLRAQLEAQRKVPRWKEIVVTEDTAAAPPPPCEVLTCYCPGSHWHWQLRASPPGGAAGAGTGRRQLHYTFRKDASPNSIWWRVSLCREEDGRAAVELRVNMQLLWEQHGRMRLGKAHSFSLITRDLLRNARSIAQLLRAPEARSGLLAGGPGKCFYPGLLDSSTRVLEHYASKAAERETSRPTGDSPSLNIRRYNNLVKVLLIESFVDKMAPPVRLLDAGCGMGQDVGKYSRAFRGPGFESYVGVDFAPEAVEEARRRYGELLERGQPEYAAAFYVGDLRKPETLEQLRRGGHGQFDVVTLQFVLQYIVESEESARALLTALVELLRPGGCVIGCIPSSEALASHYLDSGEDGLFENSLFSIRFGSDARQKIGTAEEEVYQGFGNQWGLPYTFSLVDAVKAQEEYVVPFEAFEALTESLGFEVFLDAPFPELLKKYSGSSKFYADTFAKKGWNTKFNEEEEELFSLYSSFVLRRPDDTNQP